MASTVFPRFAAFAGILALVGCGSGDDLSRDFGLQRDAPDEFQVTTRAPLSIPPDFQLRPPDPGAPRPQERTITQSAEVTVAPQTALAPQPSGGDSPGQDALIAAAGTPPPPDIRSKVEAEAARSGSNELLTDRLMFWKPSPQPGVIVDSQKEADRLHANAALGQSPDVGETPMIQPKHANLIDSLWPF
jgi:hypothetical protein